MTSAFFAWQVGFMCEQCKNCLVTSFQLFSVKDRDSSSKRGVLPDPWWLLHVFSSRWTSVTSLGFFKKFLCAKIILKNPVMEQDEDPDVE